MTIPAILVIILLAAMTWQVGSGIVFAYQHAMAWRRSRHIKIPGPEPIDDELPYQFPDDDGLCNEPEWQPRQSIRENVAVPF